VINWWHIDERIWLVWWVCALNVVFAPLRRGHRLTMMTRCDSYRVLDCLPRYDISIWHEIKCDDARVFRQRANENKKNTMINKESELHGTQSPKCLVSCTSKRMCPHVSKSQHNMILKSLKDILTNVTLHFQRSIMYMIPQGE
jgi:hypothetical protein